MQNNHENDVLLKALEADAMAQSSRIVKAAEDAAAEMLRQANIEIKTLESECVATLRLSLEREAAVRLSGARLLARAAGLQARHDVIEEVFEAVSARIGKLDAGEYTALIQRLYEELKAGWTLDEPFVVSINPQDAGLLRDDGAEVRLEAAVTRGVVFSTRDGKVRYENTAVSRIKMTRANLVPVIDKILFGDRE